MNSQKQLLEQAKPFDSNPAVAAILASIHAENASATNEIATLRAHADVQAAALAYEDGIRIVASHVDVVATAGKLGARMATLNTLFATLACTLDGLGVKTNY